MYCSPHIIWVIKSRRISWAGHMAHVGESRGVYGKLERRLFERLGRDGQIILKQLFKQRNSYELLNYSGSQQGHVAGTCEYGLNKMWEFLDQLLALVRTLLQGVTQCFIYVCVCMHVGKGTCYLCPSIKDSVVTVMAGSHVFLQQSETCFLAVPTVDIFLITCINEILHCMHLDLRC